MRKCKTPGAIYSTSINDKKVDVSIALPFNLKIDKKEAIQLENNLHNAIESVLSVYFKKH